MQANHDYVALDWVKDEIESTLKQAQQSLEAYSENPQDVTRLRFCLTYLHQVHGTLQMVEFFGASLLSEEMEKLAQAILNEQVTESESAQEALLRATFELPDYLDKVRECRKDMPIIVLPILNELRTARGDFALSETALFNPNMESGNEAFFNRPKTSDTPYETPSVRQIRQLFQVSYAALIRHKDTEAHLAKVAKVVYLMESTAQRAPAAQFWWVASALVEGLTHKSIEFNEQSLALLSILDKHLKTAVESDGESLNYDIEKDELKRFLVPIANCDAKTRLIREVKAAYGLENLVDTDMQQYATGLNRAALHSATTALLEEFNEIKDVLDVYIRSKDRKPATLIDLARTLKKSSDTLALLGYGSQRKVLIDQLDTLSWCAENVHNKTVDNKLLDVAGAMIFIESSLSGSFSTSKLEKEENQQSQLSPQHVNQAQNALIRECQAGLEAAKDHIVDFIVSQWQTKHLESVPAIFGEASGGLRIIQQDRAGKLIDYCSHYIKEQLLAAGKTPNWKSMDTLADAISSIEYYLERLVEDSHTDDYVLDIAESSLTSLGYSVHGKATEEETSPETIDQTSPANHFPIEQPAGSEPETGASPLENSNAAESPVEPETNVDCDTKQHEKTPQEAIQSGEDIPLETLTEPPYLDSEPPDTIEETAIKDNDENELIDDEIIEIFVEEATEVLEAINHQIPLLKANYESNEPLAEVRRAFHTLKGSGRLVGASETGELAWAVENMLNRVLDNTIPSSPFMIELIEQVTAMVPGFVTAFEQKTAPPGGSEALIEQANLLAEGKSVSGEREPSSKGQIIAEYEDTESAEFDATLIKIFTGEAKSHLDTLHAFLDEHPLETGPVKVSGDVLRALHTLKGSAHMANVTAIASIITPVEQLVKQVANIDYLLHNDLLKLLFNATNVLDAKIELIKANALAETVNGEEELLAQIQVLEDKYHQQKTEHSNKVSDKNFINIFLAEEMDIILEADSHLDSWEREPLNVDIAAQLEKEVQGIANHAERANIPEIEYLCQLLAKCYQLAKANPSLIDTNSFFSLAHQTHDALINLMDKLAAHQPIEAAIDIEEKLKIMLARLEAASQSTDEHAVFGEKISITAPQLAELSAPDTRDDGINEAVSPADTKEPSTDLQLDEELVEIFLEEAEEILDGLSDNLERWAEDTSNTSEIEQLQRSLHTLKGSARMSGLKPIGNLAHELETLYELATNGALTYSAKMGELLTRCHDSLADMVEAVKTRDTLREADALIKQVLTFCDSHGQTTSIKNQDETAAFETATSSPDKVTPITPAVTASIAEEFHFDANDMEVMELFVDEANELLESIESSIEHWQTEPDSDTQQHELKRLIHTLKGSSRLAGLNRLGMLSHNFESYIIKLEDHPIVDAEIKFTAIKGHYDELANWIENFTSQLKKQQTQRYPDRTTELVEKAAAASRAAQATKEQALSTAKDTQDSAKAATQEMIRVSSELLENLVNLAGETSINRAQVEKEVSDFSHTLEEIGSTIERLQEQMRRLNMETEAQILFSHEATQQEEGSEYDDFDPLEMDRYSLIHQLSRSLSESTHDLIDLKDTLSNKAKDTETLLLQQSRINTELQEGLMRTRLVPFSRLAPRLRRMVRQVGQELDKPVELEIVNAEGEMDRAVLDRLVSPLEHMLRNSLDHGIETKQERAKAGKKEKGKITLHLSREGAEVVLRLSDDGAGINAQKVRQKAIERKLLDSHASLSDTEILQFIFKPGFTTAEKVTQISGRGVGMDVVNSEIKQLGGSVRIHSSPGVGTQFTIRLPFTVSVNRALMVRVGEDSYAIPLSHIEGIVRVSPFELEAYYQPDNQDTFAYAGRDYDLQYLGAYVKDIPTPILQGQTQPLPVILVRGTEKPMAFQVDSLIGSREVVVKSLGPQLSSVTGLSGATILGDGNVVIILDLISMIRSDWAERLYGGERAIEAGPSEKTSNEIPTVMVVDDSVTVRKITSRLLERNGYEVILAKDGMDAISILQDHTPDVMLLDIEMPRMDGFEVASIVKHEERLKDIAIIMITSRTGQKHRERAMSIGVNEYLGKPFQETELLKHIERFLKVDVSV